MSEGYIYVLVNSSFGDMLKIGKTSRSPEERAAELSGNSGMPTEFIVAYSAQVSDCDEVEKLVHERLKEFRLNSGREFFRTPLRHAVQVISEIASDYRIPGISRTMGSEQEEASKEDYDMFCNKCHHRYKVTIWLDEFHSSCPQCHYINSHV